MTTRSDLPRLAGSLAVLGTELEQKGQQAWDVMADWRPGPQKPPPQWEPGDEQDDADPKPRSPAAEDRKEEMQQADRAGKRFAPYRVRLAAIDRLVQDLLTDLDVAVPPNPEEVKNRATGEFEPWTTAEIVAAGWCASCWRCDQTFTPIPVSKGYKRYKDSCGWCGTFRSSHGIDPPKELLVKHHAGRNLSTAEVDEAVKKAKQAAAPKSKKGKRGKKGKVAA